MKDDWISLAVDRWGAVGPVDDIAVCAWDQGTDRRYDANGMPVGTLTRRQSSRLMEGPASEIDTPGFPTFHGEYARPDIVGDDLDALIYFILWNSASGQRALHGL